MACPVRFQGQGPVLSAIRSAYTRDGRKHARLVLDVGADGEELRLEVDLYDALVDAAADLVRGNVVSVEGAVLPRHYTNPRSGELRSEARLIAQAIARLDVPRGQEKFQW
jgi:hypothetical protein